MKSQEEAIKLEEIVSIKDNYKSQEFVARSNAKNVNLQSRLRKKRLRVKSFTILCQKGKDEIAPANKEVWTF